MYRQVQTDTIGTLSPRYSVYEGNIFGTPALSSKSGNVSFNLVNIVEAKVFEKNDSTGKPKKVKLIDNFSIGTSYNIFADKFRWAPVSMQLMTTILSKITVTGRSGFSLYGINDSTGEVLEKFLFSQKRKLMRLTSFSASLDFSLSDLLKKNKGKNTSNTGAGANTNTSQNFGNQDFQGGLGRPDQNNQSPQNNTPALKDEYGYPVFDVPWTMNLSYSLDYTKPGLKSTFSQFLTVRGSVSLTKKMSVTYSSGYDFKAKAITMTNLAISRDLHCWEMSLNWVPNGNLQSWNFLIRVRASVLGDLKYERRKDFHDPY
jgi:hypothetical protein